ncbi:hypothetical protein GUJ93_ZPchr0006g45113 [Zizania palustris]|uniref:Uncharacterized protein n=1 Tax=Zizania palustris TaxID=103762 RepID=A0A8J5SIR8_ZIZPA|nr:hypothetical protein GUJ93_ZPchr0006g45113 [Zizania palustris]
MEPHAVGKGEGGEGDCRLRAPPRLPSASAASAPSCRLRAPWSPTRQAEEKEERRSPPPRHLSAPPRPLPPCRCRLAPPKLGGAKVRPSHGEGLGLGFYRGDPVALFRAASPSGRGGGGGDPLPRPYPRRRAAHPPQPPLHSGSHGGDVKREEKVR